MKMVFILTWYPKQGIEIPAHKQIFDKQHEVNTYNYYN